VSLERSSIPTRPTECGLGEQVEAIGLNLVGVLPVSVYDRAVPIPWRSGRLLPTAHSAILLAAGGDALFRHHRASGTSESLDDFVRRSVDEGCARLRRQGWRSLPFGYDEKRDDLYADLIELAVLSGLGGHSRLGLLVHREYGPWLSLRALVLTERRLPDSRPATQFEPCAGCPAPCSKACPVGAPRPSPAGFDIRACGEQRALQGRCQLQCDARRACVIGTEHAYGFEAEQAFMEASLSEITATKTRG
jgi:hypothetical protein